MERNGYPEETYYTFSYSPIPADDGTALSLDGDGPWPLVEVVEQHRPQVVSGLETLFQAIFPSGAWQQAPDRAVVLPIMPSGETGRAGFVIAGLNPFRLFDDNYAGFMKLIAGQIAGNRWTGGQGPASQGIWLTADRTRFGPRSRRRSQN